MQGIYRIRNKINGKYYVGSSVDIRSRWQAHRRELDRGDHHDTYLQRAWDKYGGNNFEFELAKEIVKVDDLRPIEQEYLDEGFEKGVLYNVALDATAPMAGKHFTEEHCAKLSKANSNPSEEIRAKISRANSGKNNWMYGRTGKNHPGYGRHHTEEALKKIRRANKDRKGIKISEAGCANISKSKMGKNNPMYGKPRTEEVREKIRRGMKGKNTKSYPAFHNVRAGEYIPAGRNLSKMCKDQNLSHGNLWNLKSGITQQTRDGWRLAEGET